jgi:hypothetical protein
MTVDTNRTLKKLSLSFRDVAGRALRSNSEDARPNLRRLLAFVRQTPLLAAEVDRAPAPATPIATLWQTAQEAGQRLPLPEDAVEELGMLHAAVEFLATGEEEFWNVCFNYGGDRGVEESVSLVLDEIVGTYTSHLRRVIEMALLDSADPAYGPARGINIRVEGGTSQVNVAHDQARIAAAQHVGADITAIVAAARELAALAARADLPADVRADVQEAAGVVAEEAVRPAPRRFTLRKAKEHLETLAAGLGAAGAVAEKARALGSLIGEWLPRLGPGGLN